LRHSLLPPAVVITLDGQDGTGCGRHRYQAAAFSTLHGPTPPRYAPPPTPTPFCLYATTFCAATRRRAHARTPPLYTCPPYPPPLCDDIPHLVTLTPPHPPPRTLCPASSTTGTPTRASHAFGLRACLLTFSLPSSVPTSFRHVLCFSLLGTVVGRPTKPRP